MAKKQAKKSGTKNNKAVKKSGSLHFEFKGFLSFLILHELDSRRMTGEDLAKKIGKRKGTVLTPGTIYPALKNLRQNKLIVYKRFGRKKVYSLTPLGRKDLKRFYVLFSKYFSGLRKYIRN